MRSRSLSFRRLPGRSFSAGASRPATCRSASPWSPEAALFRRVYRRQATGSLGQALPGFASCSTFALGCFVVQTDDTSADPPATTRHRSARQHLLRHKPADRERHQLATPRLLDDEDLDRFTHPLLPITGD